MENTGSFGAAIGGMSPELQEAIQRRAGGNQTGAIGQVSQSAPTYNPTVQPSQVNPTSTSSVGSSMLSTGGQVGNENQTPEIQIIEKALIKRMADLGELQKSGYQV